MKLSLVVSCVLLIVTSVSTLDPVLNNEWLSWKSFHGKQYMEEEEIYKRMIWEENMRFIQKHNQEHSMGKHTFTVEINQFGDLTTEEYNQLLTAFHGQIPDDCKEFRPQNPTVLPQTVDWRIEGLVTPVKNQGTCRSCWAFSATGALEGQMFKKKGKLVSLSEQNLIDCDKTQKGCRGGYPFRAFQYVKKHGLNSEKNYRYMAKDQDCKGIEKKVATCKDCGFIQKSERHLAAAVASIGPISICVDGSHKSFQFYKKGIYYEKNCLKPINHAMLVVGYASRANKNYWIVKNSYGTTWGDEGYIYMAKDKRNNCAIANNATYPVV
ncbi:procathepsin L [Callorhinchus milii]|uniref:procathepsin L n=1 Tax=Callorhinchus milii TaxID=7868 RepID=UPI001C3F9044|nr:procathepsin L [Callorhinchus milii]